METMGVHEFLKQDEEGDTPLHIGIIYKREDLTERLLDLADSYQMEDLTVNVPNALGQYPLHLAVLQNMPDTVRIIVLHSADVAVRDRRGNTPLHLACEKGYLECVQSLTIPITYNEFVQRRATADNSPKLTFQVIPQNGNILNYEGLSSVHLAAINGNYSILQHLVENCGYNINIQDGLSGDTVLHKAVLTCNIPLLQDLLLKYIHLLNLNLKRYDGLTAYSLAALADKMDIVHMLEMAGADASIMQHHVVSSDEQEDQVSDELPIYSDVRISGQSIDISNIFRQSLHL